MKYADSFVETSPRPVWVVWAGVLSFALVMGCEINVDDGYDPAPPPEQSSTSSEENENSEESADATEAAPPQETAPPPNTTTTAEPVEIQNETLNAEGCVTQPLSDGGGGFVSNPDNSRGTLKFILPVSYGHSVTRVTVYTASGAFFDEFYRQMPNEHGDRPRWYGTRPIGLFPANCVMKAVLQDGSCRSATIPNPQQRYD